MSTTEPPVPAPACTPPTTFLGALRRWWLPDFRATVMAFARDVRAAWLLLVAYPTREHVGDLVTRLGQLVIVLTPIAIVHYGYLPLLLRWTVLRPALLAWWRARPTLASAMLAAQAVTAPAPPEPGIHQPFTATELEASLAQRRN